MFVVAHADHVVHGHGAPRSDDEFNHKNGLKLTEKLGPEVVVFVPLDVQNRLGADPEPRRQGSPRHAECHTSRFDQLTNRGHRPSPSDGIVVLGTARVKVDSQTRFGGPIGELRTEP